MTRKKIAAGNWKMNLNASESQQLVSEVTQMYKDEYHGEGKIIFTPAYPFLSMVGHLIKDIDNVHLAAQNVHEEEQGAYTGEVSAAMLASVGVEYCIVGHSERRTYFHETNELLAKKIHQVLAHEMNVIYCIGERLEEREANQTLDIIRTQMTDGAFHLDATQFSRVVIAYEPVWAIGTGNTATPEQAQEVHRFIRELVSKQYDTNTAEQTTILYGGSVKPGNAPDLFAQPDIDGGLVGGACLKSRDFIEIIKVL